MGDTYRARQAQQQAQALTTQPIIGYVNVVVTPPAWIDKIKFDVKLAPPSAIQRADRKRAGLCIECGDDGEFIAMACFCRAGHGKIFG